MAEEKFPRIVTVNIVTAKVTADAVRIVPKPEAS